MSDAFIRALEVKKLDPEEVKRMADPQAYKTFSGVRWIETEGEPQCPRCQSVEAYRYRARQIFKCKVCDRQYSVTTATAFQSRKLPFQGVLHCLTTVADDASISASNLGREMGVNARTAWALGKKLNLKDGRGDRTNPSRRVALAYPYMPKPAPTDDHAMVLAINALIPRDWPEHMRADVGQEVALGILCGDYDRTDLPEALDDARRKYGRMYRGKWGDLSLDAPAYGPDQNLRLIDMIASDREHW